MSKNTYLYKDGEAKLFEESEVDDMMAEGWFDNPSETSLDGPGNEADTSEHLESTEAKTKAKTKAKG